MARSRFTMTAMAAWNDDRLTSTDLLVLGALGCFTDENGWCWPSYKKVAAKSRSSEKTVQRAMRRLVECGYVERQIPDNGDLSNIKYRVVLDTLTQPLDVAPPPVTESEGASDTKSEGLRTESPKPPVTQSEGLRQGVLSLRTQSPPNKIQRTTSKKQTGQDSDLEGLFTDLWCAFRDRLRAGQRDPGIGKQKAWEIFTRKARSHDPVVIHQAGLAYVRANENAKYLKGIGPWLNAEAWDTGGSAKPKAEWPARLAQFQITGVWNPDWGPKPGEPGCQAELQAMEG